MQDNMMCKGCGKPETECTCPDCPCKGGKCETGCAIPGVCNCGHHKIIPGLIIIFGLVYLLEALGVMSMGAASIIWAILVILGGVAKWVGGSCKCYHKHY